MTVSIIIPVYKVENEIERCLMSVIEQDYDDIEIVIINDATPDNSFVLAKALIEAQNQRYKVKYVTHSENQGLSVARNSGLSVATGTYLFFLDSDDGFTEKDSISKLVQIAHDSQADIVIGNYQHVKGTNIRPARQLIIGSYDGQEAVYSLYAKQGIYWAAWGKLISRKLVIDNNLLFKTGIYSEDILWSFELFKIAKTAYISPDIVYNYHEREGSIMSDINQKHVDDLYFIMKTIYGFYQKSPTKFSKDTAFLLERLRRIMLQYLFKRGVTITSEAKLDMLSQLQLIKLPLLATSKLRYIKQNLLLRFPVYYINRYFSVKWG